MMAENHISTLTFVEKFISSPDKLGDIVTELIGGYRRFPLNFLRNAEAEEIFGGMEGRPFSDYYRFARAYMHKLHPWWWNRQTNTLVLGGISFRVINGRIERHFNEKFGGYKHLFAPEPGQKTARKIARSFKTAAASQKAVNKYYMKYLVSLKEMILSMIDEDGPFMVTKFYDFVLYNLDEDAAEIFRSIEVGMKNIREILKDDKAANLDFITGMFRKFQQAYGRENGNLFIERMSWDGLLVEYCGHLEKLMGGDAARGGPLAESGVRESQPADAEAPREEPDAGSGPESAADGVSPADEKKKTGIYSDARHIAAYAALVKETCLDVLGDGDIKKIKAVISGMYGKNIQFIGEEGSAKMVKAIIAAWLDDDSLSEAKKEALRDAYDAMCASAEAVPHEEEPEPVEVTIIEDTDEEYAAVPDAPEESEIRQPGGLHREEEPGRYAAGERVDAEPAHFDIGDAAGVREPARFKPGDAVLEEADSFDISGGKDIEAGNFDIGKEVAEQDHIRTVDEKEEEPRTFDIDAPSEEKYPEGFAAGETEEADTGTFEPGAMSAGEEAGRFAIGDGKDADTGAFDIGPVREEKGTGRFAVGDGKDAGPGSFATAPPRMEEESTPYTGAGEKDDGEAGTFTAGEENPGPEEDHFKITDTDPEKLARYFLDIRDWSEEENRTFLGELVSASLRNKPATVLKFFEQIINSVNVDPLVKNAVIEGYAGIAKSELFRQFYILNKSIQGESDPEARLHIVNGFRKKFADHHMADFLSGLLDNKEKYIERESALRGHENRVFEELKNTQGDRSGILDMIRSNKSLSPAFRSVVRSMHGAQEFERVFLAITSSNTSPGQKISFLMELRSLAENVYHWINDDVNDKESVLRKKRLDDKIIFYTNIIAGFREESAKFRIQKSADTEHARRPGAQGAARTKGPPDGREAGAQLSKEERIFDTAASIITSFNEMPEKTEPLINRLKAYAGADVRRTIEEEMLKSKSRKEALIDQTVKMIKSKNPNMEVLKQIQTSTPLFQFVWSRAVLERLKAKSLDEAFSIFAADKEFHKDALRIVRVIGINNASGILENALKGEERLLEQISNNLSAGNLRKLWHAVRSGKHKDKVKLFREFLDLAGIDTVA